MNILGIGATRARVLVNAAGLACLCGMARGQNIFWNGGTGSWNVPANWTPNNVPDIGSENAIIAALGTYEVNQSGDVTVGTLTISNPNATVNVLNGALMRNNAGISNDGLIVINNAGGAGTSLYLQNSVGVTGDGAIELRASGNLDTATISSSNGAFVLTNGAGHTIRGTGNLYAATSNNGLISANQDQKRVVLLGSAKTNAGRIEAVNGGVLDVATTITQSTGEIAAAQGGQVQVHATISGGLVSADASTSVNITGDSTLIGVAKSGTMNVLNSVPLRITSDVGGVFANDGLLLLNPSAGGGGTPLVFNNSTTLAGTGEIRLNASGNLDTAYVTGSGAGVVLTVPQSQNLHGTGNIYIALVNNSVISADVSGRSLSMVSVAKTNNATMRAVNGGILDLYTPVAQSAAGTLLADGGVMNLRGITVSGGRVTAQGGSTIDVVGDTTLAGVVKSGPLNLVNSVPLRITPDNGGVFQNDGLILVNTTAGGSGTPIVFNASTTLSGTGEIRLNASGNLDTAYVTGSGAGVVLTVPQSQNLHGTGNIYVALVNNSVISADAPGRSLQLLSSPKTNNNVLRCVTGSTLDVSTTISQAPGGVILADGGVLNIRGVTIVGGSVVAQNGSTIDILGDTTFNNVIKTGTLNLPNSVPLRITPDGGGVFQNNGLILVNTTAGGNGTPLIFNAATTLAGTGEIRLNASGNLDTASIAGSGGAVLTVPPTQNVHGTGNLPISLVNNSVISADVAGRSLSLTSSSKTNNATFQAINGATLDVSTAITQSSAGRIVANGGGLNIRGVTITGGTVTAQGGSTIEILGDSTFDGVIKTGTLNIPNSVPLRITPDAQNVFQNNGLILVNTSSGGNGTPLIFNRSTTLAGIGEVRLNASGNPDTAAITSAGSNAVLTVPASQNVHGTGSLQCPIINNSTITADVPGRAISLNGFSKTNNALIRCIGGGILDCRIAISQGAAGVLLGDGGPVNIWSISVIGGAVQAQNAGGVININGDSTFVGVAKSGPLLIPNSVPLRITPDGAGEFLNNGPLTVNTSAGGNGTYLILNGPTTVTGTGQIVLNSSGNLDTAQLAPVSAGHVLHLGPAQTLAGRGRDYMITVADGTISPGAVEGGVGQLDFQRSLTMGSSCVTLTEIAGTGAAQYDRVTSSSSVSLGGELQVSYREGFSPSRGDVFTVVSCASRTGTFENVTVPAFVNGIGLRARYTPTAVLLEAICYADVNDDGGIDGADVEAFFSIWEAGDPVADINSDGGVDGADVEMFFQLWEGGGC